MVVCSDILQQKPTKPHNPTKGRIKHRKHPNRERVIRNEGLCIINAFIY